MVREKDREMEFKSLPTFCGTKKGWVDTKKI